MKNPPSASVSPPIHTTQRVPIVSSKPRSGCGNGGGGGGGVAAPRTTSFEVTEAAAGATDLTSGMMGGGVAAAVEAGGNVRSNTSNGVSGGGPATATVAGAAWIACRRSRNSATWFMAFRAMIKATIAIRSAKKTKGSSGIWPPGGHVKVLTGHVVACLQSYVRPCPLKVQIGGHSRSSWN